MKKISKLLTLALIAGVGIFGSCKDVNEDMFQDMTQKSQNADGRIAALEKALGEAATQLITYKTALEAELAKKADITTLDEYAKKVTVDQINELLDQLELADPQKEAELLALVNGTAGKLDALTDIVTALASDVSTLKTDVATLKTTTDNLKKAIDDNYAELSAEIIAANELAQKAYDLAKADSMSNEEAMDLAQSAFDLATENSKYIETLNEFMKNFNKNYKKFFDRELPKMQKTLAELEEKVFLFEFQMENLVNPAIEDFRALEKDYALVKADVELLQAQMAEVLNYLDRQITSIVNQGAFNRLFGYVSTPVGNSNMLLALYSKNLKSAGQDFPIYEAGYEKNEETGKLTKNDIQILVDGGLKAATIEEEEEASAGKVFFTVNPAEANLKGTEFTLENSIGEEVFQLQNIAPVSQAFHYGIDFSTRATVDSANVSANGLYQADVILPTSAIEGKAIHLGEILSEYKNILSQRTINSDVVKSLVSTTVNFVNKTSKKFETNAIKALWSDSYGDHSIYSAYEYGIAAITPISYGMLEDKSVSVAKFLQKINFEEQMQRLINSGFNFNFDMGQIDMTDLDNDAIIDLVAKINNALLNAGNNMNSQITEVKNKVENILDRLVNNRFVQYEITPNHLLLPVLFYADADGDLHTLGTTKEEATLVEMANGDQLVKLVGSSLTAEMLAPAYKKFIGITNVYNANHDAQEAGQFALKAAALDVNKTDGFDEVVDGSVIDFDFVVPQRNDAQKGYIYEITYSAMDYAGNTITNKYYIRLQ